MEIQALPRYRGLSDSRRGWGKEDGRPSLSLRDLVVLSLIVVISFPLIFRLTFDLWLRDWTVHSLNAGREREMELEMRRDLRR